ncbi:hypothetical protein DIPPA_29778 [Diplonema papillatum]|nr:hypothetical protein DIPPA_29778 [Diplonema papillatum]
MEPPPSSASSVDEASRSKSHAVVVDLVLLFPIPVGRSTSDLRVERRGRRGRGLVAPGDEGLSTPAGAGLRQTVPVARELLVARLKVEHEELLRGSMGHEAKSLLALLGKLLKGDLEAAVFEVGTRLRELDGRARRGPRWGSEFARTMRGRKQDPDWEKAEKAANSHARGWGGGWNAHEPRGQRSAPSRGSSGASARSRSPSGKGGKGGRGRK